MTSRVALLPIILAVLFADDRGTFASQNSGERSKVIDGDTLQIAGDVVQLYGIDAPELGQLCESDGRVWHCGLQAALALAKLVSLNRSLLHCSPWSKAGGGVADPAPANTPRVCEVGNEDVALLMLHSGNSLALPEAFPDYLDAEREARDAGLGVWHSDFVPPWQWRAGVTSPDRPSDSARECNVKGVLGPDGQRIYYVPTDAEYQAITIDSAQGDTVFCSDDEARSAGWRRMGETASVDD
jgi:endonuclease YncB( thermonuclease family)